MLQGRTVSFGKWCFAVGASACSFGMALALAFGPGAYPSFAPSLFWGGVVILVLGAIVMLIGRGGYSLGVAAEGLSMGDTYHNSGNNFGHLGPVNYGKPPRVLSELNRTRFRTTLPRDRQIDVVSVLGDQEAFQLAHDLYRFLNEAGFLLTEGVSQAVFVQPVLGVQVILDEDPVRIVVGSNIT